MTTYHYPPELFNLLVDTIPLLCRSKQDVFIFFKGAGVRDKYMAEPFAAFQKDRNSVNKYQIVRHALRMINEGGDRDLAVRREVLKRVVEFEDFSSCWPDDQLKAKGLVAEIRRVQNVKDTFTKLNQERQREAERARKAHQDEIARIKAKKERAEKVKRELYALFGESDAQKRGKALEGVLNEFFRPHGILLKEDFKLRSAGAGGIIEQIDGVISLDGSIYLVEMKWYDTRLGPGEISQHIVRVFGRAGAGGIFIAANGFTEAALEIFRTALVQKVVFCVELEEVVYLLDAESDLRDALRSKVQAAVMDKNPLSRIMPKR